MKKIHKIERETPGDRRTALLALASNRKDVEKISHCLSSGSMASLIDGECSPDERDTYFDHLGSCETCYQQWLEVSMVADIDERQKGGNKIIQFLKPVNLAWTGSMLAAAASVVLYLNIQQDALPPVMQESKVTEMFQVTKAVQRQEIDEKEIMSAVADEATVSMEAGAEPQIEPITPAAPSHHVEEKSFSHSISPAISLKKQKNEPAPVAIPESIPVKTTLGTRGTTGKKDVTNDKTAKISTPRQLNAKEWLNQIKQACLAQEDDTTFWKQQFEDGQELAAYSGLALLEAFDSSMQKRMTRDILPYVEQLQTSKNRRSICNNIFDRLEKF